MAKTGFGTLACVVPGCGWKTTVYNRGKAWARLVTHYDSVADYRRVSEEQRLAHAKIADRITHRATRGY
jgi:hypothetical protein